MGLATPHAHSRSHTRLCLGSATTNANSRVAAKALFAGRKICRAARQLLECQILPIHLYVHHRGDPHARAGKYVSLLLPATALEDDDAIAEQGAEFMLVALGQIMVLD